jgi:hypothetical protein
MKYMSYRDLQFLSETIFDLWEFYGIQGDISFDFTHYGHVKTVRLYQL